MSHVDGHNPNTLMSHDDLIPLDYIEKFHCPGGRRFAIDCDRAIHHCRAYFDLLAFQANESLLIGGDVELCRENSVRWRLCQLHVHPLRDFGAMLSQTQDQFIQRLSGGGRNFDAGKALVRAFFADTNLGDLEMRAVSQDLIQHLGQNKRIDNMTAQLDRFRKHPPILADQIRCASLAILLLLLEKECRLDF